MEVVNEMPISESRLQRIRMKNGAKQVGEVATAIKASAGNVSAIERGVVVSGLGMLKRLAGFYGLEFSEIYRAHMKDRADYLEEELARVRKRIATGG